MSVARQRSANICLVKEQRRETYLHYCRRIELSHAASSPPIAIRSTSSRGAKMTHDLPQQHSALTPGDLHEARALASAVQPALFRHFGSDYATFHQSKGETENCERLAIFEAERLSIKCICSLNGRRLIESRNGIDNIIGARVCASVCACWAVFIADSHR